MPSKIYLTVLIPCYNEGKIIEESLQEVYSFLSEQKYPWEIVVVDDGSSDNSVNVIKSLHLFNINLVTYKKNRGKGGALKEGINNSRGKFIIFTDADLSVPISTVRELLEKLRSGKSEVVIGTRKIRSAKVLAHQPWLRENLGKGFTLITRLITAVRVSDFTCGFKGFSSGAARKIFSHSLISRWAYDAEILYLAKKYGFKISEVPVTWVNRKDTRVRLGNAIITSFVDLIKIKLNDWSGKYEN